jgi:4-carboxymuconolactone decarboxylase
MRSVVTRAARASSANLPPNGMTPAGDGCGFMARRHPHDGKAHVPDDPHPHLVDYRMTLRDLTIRSDAFVQSVLSSDEANLAVSKLEPKTHALVRLGAMIAMGAGDTSYRQVVDAAHEAGATTDEIVGALIAVISATGVPRVVAAAPSIALALGYDVGSALEDVGSESAATLVRVLHDQDED